MRGHKRVDDSPSRLGVWVQKPKVLYLDIGEVDAGTPRAITGPVPVPQMFHNLGGLQDPSFRGTDPVGLVSDLRFEVRGFGLGWGGFSHSPW